MTLSSVGFQSSPRLIESILCKDERGFLVKISQPGDNPSLGRPFQDVYVSESRKNVFRGLHYQLEPFSQEKYFNCIQGEAMMYCVLVSSPDVVMQFSLLPAYQSSLYVPKGWATGFHSKRSSTKLLYASHQKYSPEHEAGLHFDHVSIPNNARLLVSQKDQLWEKA